MKDPKGEAARWLKQAEYDLQVAQYDAAGGYHANACFNAQQAAEKALKAFLYRQGARQVTGHSVGELCKHAGKFRKGFQSLVARAKKLDRYYIPTRYPNGLPGGVPSESYDASDSKLALELASEVINTVKPFVEAA